MEHFLLFAKGPLFAVTFSFMVIGLIRVAFLQTTQLYECVGRLSDRKFNIVKNLKQFAGWLIPVNHIYHQRPIISIVSFTFHIGLLIVPIFLVNHIDLWRNMLGFGWPGISTVLADVLTLITIIAGVILFFARLFNAASQALSAAMDYFLLILLMVPFVSGFMAFHPAVNPLSYNAMILTHILSAELVFVLIPTTKLSHCVLFPFDRFSSEVFWKMPAGAGEAVARELHGEEARI